MSRRRSTRGDHAPVVAMVLAIVAVAAMAVVAYTVGHALGTPTAAEIASHSLAATTASPGATPTPLADIARSALPSTVTIETLQTGSEEFGTGWLIDSKGDFVTNAHVIANGLSIRIRDRKGNTHVGLVMGIDTAQDVAVVRSSDGFVGTVLSLSTVPVTIGAPVVALASSRATGHGDTTIEQVTALGKIVPVKGTTNLDPHQHTTTTTYNDMMQIAGAQIFPGNSGGPLLDNSGGVVGIVTLAGRDDVLAYAIPLTRVLAELHIFDAKQNPSPAG